MRTTLGANKGSTQLECPANWLCHIIWHNCTSPLWFQSLVNSTLPRLGILGFIFLTLQTRRRLGIIFLSLKHKIYDTKGKKQDEHFSIAKRNRAQGGESG